jgi:hypothetical protein
MGSSAKTFGSIARAEVGLKCLKVCRGKERDTSSGAIVVT